MKCIVCISGAVQSTVWVNEEVQIFRRSGERGGLCRPDRTLGGTCPLHRSFHACTRPLHGVYQQFHVLLTGQSQLTVYERKHSGLEL